ncbi:hypothetical protein SEA_VALENTINIPUFF_46 [Microbacterium phage ValentiniPuff]|uniref:Uncharacterized protein n=1 Tax=Microbacterium phage ValentiniPuff TaxID=2315705 RepID=A0A386KSN4_9CAUD|nr:hypothetical protein SEA_VALENTINIPUFF_46 [Microbacterium phage ValentiniPuff]
MKWRKMPMPHPRTPLMWLRWLLYSLGFMPTGLLFSPTMAMRVYNADTIHAMSEALKNADAIVVHERKP